MTYTNEYHHRALEVLARAALEQAGGDAGRVRMIVEPASRGGDDYLAATAYSFEIAEPNATPEDAAEHVYAGIDPAVPGGDATRVSLPYDELAKLRAVADAARKLPWFRDSFYKGGLRLGGAGSYGAAQFFIPEPEAFRAALDELGEG